MFSDEKNNRVGRELRRRDKSKFFNFIFDQIIPLCLREMILSLVIQGVYCLDVWGENLISTRF